MAGKSSLLKQEADAARALLTELRAEGLSDDVELVADMIEAETNLLEAIDIALAEMDEVEALTVGLKEKERQFLQRRQALDARGARLRALIEQAMATTEQRMLRRPTATLSLRNLPPQVVVVAEAEIPSDYFIAQPPPPPKLDTKRLREDLMRLREAAMAGDAAEHPPSSFREIPGVVLNNGGQSLQVRRF